MNMGTVRVDENIYPIVDIWLTSFGMGIKAYRMGPLPEASGIMRIFRANGEPWIVENAPLYNTEVVIPAASPFMSATINIPIVITEVASGGKDPADGWEYNR